MNKYWVEGLIASKSKGKHSSRELFSTSVWAKNPGDAIIAAEERLGDRKWAEAPKVSVESEEERMRSMGAPELPGIFKTQRKKKKDNHFIISFYTNTLSNHSLCQENNLTRNMKTKTISKNLALGCAQIY
jgi:hypothetical protein